MGLLYVSHGTASKPCSGSICFVNRMGIVSHAGSQQLGACNLLARLLSSLLVRRTDLSMRVSG